MPVPNHVCRVRLVPISGHEPGEGLASVVTGTIELVMRPIAKANIVVPLRLTVPTTVGDHDAEPAELHPFRLLAPGPVPADGRDAARAEEPSLSIPLAARVVISGLSLQVCGGLSRA